jgi:uncharacterized membrane protein
LATLSGVNKPPAKSDAIEGGATEQEIARELEPYLRPDKKSQGLAVVSTIIRREHRGPLPAPEDFEHYDHVLPGGAERIMRLTEREQAHRHKQEGRLVTGEYATRILGQVGALLALAMLLVLVGYCAAIGQPIAAGVIGAIGAIVVAFLKYSAQRLEHEEPPAAPKPRRKRKK